MRKKRFFLPAAAALVCVTLAAAYGTSGAADAQPVPVEDYVMEQVQEFLALKEQDDSITWSETTKISSVLPLYAPDDTVNGYICYLETDGEATGTMQVGVQDGEYYVMNLGFDGGSILDAQLETCSALTGETVSVGSEQKVYFTGAFNYYLETADGSLLFVQDGETVSRGADRLTQEYAAFSEQLAADLETEGAEGATEG